MTSPNQSRNIFNKALEAILQLYPNSYVCKGLLVGKHLKIQPKDSLDEIIGFRIIDEDKSSKFYAYSIDVIYCPPKSRYNNKTTPIMQIRMQQDKELAEKIAETLRSVELNPARYELSCSIDAVEAQLA